MTTGRSAGKTQVARSIWYAGKGVVELRSAPLPPLAPDAVRVRTQFSGVSRGTERLVLNGLIPASEAERMRAPLQDGAFPFPVKYGYAAAGVVEAGAKELVGRSVFCLHPHQDVFQVPAGLAVPLPDGLSTRRATLAAKRTARERLNEFRRNARRVNRREESAEMLRLVAGACVHGGARRGGAHRRVAARCAPNVGSRCARRIARAATERTVVAIGCANASGAAALGCPA